MTKQNHKTLIPSIRFPEFVNDEEWGTMRLGEIFERITDKNKENNQNVLTISAQYGLVSQYDYFNKSVASTDVSGYYILHRGDFAYNKSRSQNHPFGAIKVLKLYDKGVVSPLYICFRAKEGKDVYIPFFEHLFETSMIANAIGKIAKEGARNHGLLNISTDEFFNIPIIFPPLSEQQKIADVLSSLDKQIDSCSEKITLLEEHKRGLMKRLFPSK